MSDPKTLQELFSKDGSWCQKLLAKDNKGKACAIQTPEAKSWCLIGGMYKVYGHNTNISDKIHDGIMPEQSISIWNDNKKRTIEDVRALVKELNI